MELFPANIGGPASGRLGTAIVRPRTASDAAQGLLSAPLTERTRYVPRAAPVYRHPPACAGLGSGTVLVDAPWTALAGRRGRVCPPWAPASCRRCAPGTHVGRGRLARMGAVARGGVAWGRRRGPSAGHGPHAQRGTR